MGHCVVDAFLFRSVTFLHSRRHGKSEHLELLLGAMGSEFVRSVLFAGRFAQSREDGCLTSRGRRTKEVVLRSSLGALCCPLCVPRSTMWSSFLFVAKADVFFSARGTVCRRVQRFPPRGARRGARAVTVFGFKQKLKFNPCVDIWMLSGSSSAVVGLVLRLGRVPAPPSQLFKDAPDPTSQGGIGNCNQLYPMPPLKNARQG